MATTTAQASRTNTTGGNTLKVEASTLLRIYNQLGSALGFGSQRMPQAMSRQATRQQPTTRQRAAAAGGRATRGISTPARKQASMKGGKATQAAAQRNPQTAQRLAEAGRKGGQLRGKNAGGTKRQSPRKAQPANSQPQHTGPMDNQA